MTEDIEELKKEVERLKQRIAELQVGNGRLRIKYEHRPNDNDIFNARRAGIEPKEYDLYTFQCLYEPVEGKSMWRTMLGATTREEVIEKIPDLIKDIELAYKHYKEQEHE